ncbi:MAG: mannose-1-phosphate guanylyltransferase [Bacteroidetes bacterium]|uniref:mannose-1-phosphate guanylyltransferase n=1 Tax=Phnomibacter sp. TaxID=2836217 RepID=UPI002FDD1924|nr:mannose-1-phosphate guanylyltransferase [Bacteroidota bacterium]
MNNHQYVAIMAGGIGSRFWPMSRNRLPKQFLDVLGTGQTLLQSTYNRFAAFVPAENIFIITFEEYAPLVAQQLPDLPQANILKEPSRKSTAPCVAYMAFKLMQRNPEASFIVSPSDHLVLDQQGFAKLAQQALQFAEERNALVTLGINPTYPNTGYGYIQYDQVAVENNVFKVKTFTEKPNLELAKTFMASGDFLWNAGIFVWKAADVLHAFEQHLPEMYEVFAAEANLFDTEQEHDALVRIYPQCTNISIDYGIMEKAQNVHIIPASIGWSDLGTWNSAYENMDKDYLGNAVTGKNVMVIDATRNMVHVPDSKMVVLQGLDDFVIVDTNDVLLICKKDREQEIKDYMAEVKRNKGDKYL